MFLLMIVFITAIESKLTQKGIFENSDFFYMFKSYNETEEFLRIHSLKT